MRRHWDMTAWQDLGEVSAVGAGAEKNPRGADGEEEGNLISRVWPGGYPVVYVDPEDESEGLCADTVREMIAAGEWPDGRTVDSYTHYEGPAVECTCGKIIEAAYGDPSGSEGSADD